MNAAWVICWGLVHFLHSLQVSTMSCTKSKTRFGKPAASSTLVMLFLGACHHRKCSFLSSLWRVALSSANFRVLKTVPISNLVQSDLRSVPSPLSSHDFLFLVCGARVPAGFGGPSGPTGWSLSSLGTSASAVSSLGSWIASRASRISSPIAGSGPGASTSTASRRAVLDELPPITVSGNSPSCPKSSPCVDCAWASLVSESVAGFLPCLGCAPCLGALLLKSATAARHSPGS